MAGMCIGDIKLGDDNKVTDIADQFVHTRLFLMVNIRLMTYAVVVYLPTQTLSTHNRLLLSFNHGNL